MFAYFKRISITIKIIVYFLAISNISLYIVGRYSFGEASDALLNRTFQQLTSIRVEKSKRLDDFFQQRISDLNMLSLKGSINSVFHCFYKKSVIEDYDTNCVLGSESGLFLKGFLNGNKFFTYIVFVDTLNRVFIFNGYQFRQSSTYLSHIKVNDLHSGLHELSKEFGDSKLIINKLIIEKNRVIGSVILELSKDFIDEIMLENNSYNGLGTSGETYLVGNDYLMRSSSRFIHNSVLKVQVKSEGVKDALKQITNNKIIQDYRNIAVLSSYSPLHIQGLDWVILAEIDKSEAMIPILSLKNSIIYLSIVISLLLLGVVALLSSSLLSPLKKLQREAEAIYEGEYGHTIPINYNNEIGSLINAFNKMSLQLRDQQEKIELEKIMRLTSLIEGQEIERSRLSQELHDGLAQQLMATKLLVEKIDDKNFNEKIFQIRDEFVSIISEIRNISNDLMPSVLVNFGFKKAVEELYRKINSSGIIKFQLSYNSDIETISKRVDLYLYRIIQEALNNTLKHSHATIYNLEIESNDNFTLVITDNGTGFQVDKRNEGNGLRNIRERVNIMDGQIEIYSKTGQGVKINIIIPL